MSVGEMIRKARKEQNVNQDELAARVGVNSVSLSYWESGKREIKLSVLEKIAKVLDLPLSYFYEEHIPSGYNNELSPLGTIVLKDRMEHSISFVPVIDFKSILQLHSGELNSKDIREDKIAVPDERIRGYNIKDLFFCRYDSTDMHPFVLKEDLLLCAICDAAKDNSLVICRLNKNKENTVKLRRLIIDEKGYCLKAQDESTKDLFVGKDGTHIVAKVIKIERNPDTGFEEVK